MKTRSNSFSNVWDAVADTPEQAANLHMRADLMHQIAEIIRAEGWKQADAAQRCGVTQPRINDLLRGRVSRFSLDALVNIATALGRRVSFKLRAAQHCALALSRFHASRTNPANISASNPGCEFMTI